MSFDDSGSIYQKTVDPTINDDYSQDYVEGDSWENTVTGKTFKLFNGTIGAADWKSGSGTTTPGDVGGGAASMVMSFASGNISYIEGNSSTYQKLASFIYGGTDAIGAINKININAWVTNNGAVDIRLVCCGDGSIVAEFLGINTQDENNLVNMGTVNNLPTSSDFIEIQGRKISGGGASKLRIGSVELEY